MQSAAVGLLVAVAACTEPVLAGFVIGPKWLRVQTRRPDKFKDPSSRKERGKNVKVRAYGHRYLAPEKSASLNNKLKATTPPPLIVPKNVVTPNIERDLEGAQAVRKELLRGSQGNEGDEGNEGLKEAIQNAAAAADFNEGDEGHPSFKELPTHTAKIPKSTAADEGDEGDEGNEGDEGSAPPEKKQGKVSIGSVCTSKGTAGIYSGMTFAHVSAVDDVTAELCGADFDGHLAASFAAAKKHGKAITAVLARAQSNCVTSGNAFGCASASATAIAWAEASAEAHGKAVTLTAELCPCLAGTQVQGALTGSGYIQLIADAFYIAEARACSTGDQSSSASAYYECGAAAYADLVTSAFARAMIEGECWDTEVSRKVGLSVDRDFSVSTIEGCQAGDEASGNARGFTDRSDIDAQTLLARRIPRL